MKYSLFGSCALPAPSHFSPPCCFLGGLARFMCIRVRKFSYFPTTFPPHFLNLYFLSFKKDLVNIYSAVLLFPPPSPPHGCQRIKSFVGPRRTCAFCGWVHQSLRCTKSGFPERIWSLPEGKDSEQERWESLYAVGFHAHLVEYTQSCMALLSRLWFCTLPRWTWNSCWDLGCREHCQQSMYRSCEHTYSSPLDGGHIFSHHSSSPH